MGHVPTFPNAAIIAENISRISHSWKPPSGDDCTSRDLNRSRGNRENRCPATPAVTAGRSEGAVCLF